MSFLQSHFGSVQYMSSDELAEGTKVTDSPPIVRKEGEEEDAKPVLEFGDEQVSAGEKDGLPIGKHVDEGQPSGPIIRLRMDDSVADISMDDLSVRSDNEAAQRRIESVLQVALRTITPLAPIQPKSNWTSAGGNKRISVKAEAAYCLHR